MRLLFMRDARGFPVLLHLGPLEAAWPSQMAPSFISRRGLASATSGGLDAGDRLVPVLVLMVQVPRGSSTFSPAMMPGKRRTYMVAPSLSLSLCVTLYLSTEKSI